MLFRSSQFTGASRELRDAIIVNPYDVEQVSDAIRTALEMDPEERQIRMRHMRRIVKENNVYRWAGSLITELSEIRVEEDDSGEAVSDQPKSAASESRVVQFAVPPRTSFGG